MDFTNSTHGPGCHNPPGPRTCRHKLPTHLGLSLSPGTLEGHQPQVLAIHPPQKTHTHSKHYCTHPKESLRPPRLKGQYLFPTHPALTWKGSESPLATQVHLLHTERESRCLSRTPHPTPNVGLGYLHCRLAGCGQAKDSSPAKQELPVALRSKPAPGPAAPYSRRGPGANVSMQSYIATRLGGKLGARNTEDPQPIPPPPPAVPRSWRGGGGGLA